MEELAKKIAAAGGPTVEAADPRKIAERQPKDQ